MAADLMFSFLMRAVLVAALLCIVGADTNCRSLPPKTEKAIETSESLDNDIDASHATPEEKANMKKKNADVRTTVKEQGKDIAKKDVEIKRLEWYEEHFWLIVCCIGGIVLGSVGIWLLRRRFSA